MAYLRICRDLGTGAAEIQARLLALLDARSGAVSRAGGYWLSNLKSPFGQPGYATVFQPCHCVAARFGVLFAALILAASGAAQAKSVTALSPSFFDVTKAIGSAGDGDTVIVPAGTATWTATLVITKAITLMGQTTTDSLAGTAKDQTTIQYNLNGGPLISVQSVAGKPYRVTGFTFGSISSVATKNMLINLTGESQSVRLDHCHFALATKPQASMVQVGGLVYGVADHNVIEQPRTITFRCYNGTKGDLNGNFSWSQPTGWGGSQFFFIEDNYVKNFSTVVTSLTDGGAGCKMVVRHNHCYNVHQGGVHGTEGQRRGGRAMEIYNNDFHNTFADTVGGIRSGGLLFYNNTFEGGPWQSHYSLSVYRVQNTWSRPRGGSSQAFTGWGGADGSCPWDVNETEGKALTNPPGAYVEGHAPFQYFPTTPGTWATAGAGTTELKIVDQSNPGWTTGKWKDFGILKKDDGLHNIIDDTTNGNTNLVPSTVSFTGYRMTWAPGSQYQIHKCLVALDQQSRGQGDLVTGTPNHYVNSKTGTRAWPHQQLDPVYSWNSRVIPGGAYIGVQSHEPVMHENTDYYNQAAPVDGVQKVGVGVGTLAGRPARGVNGTDIAGVTKDPPGTAYWATDVPSKNGSTDKGALYVWRGGAWVLYYQPYTYPHPLTLGLEPPSNLRVAP